MKQVASHIVFPCTFVGHLEAGHTIYVSLCPAIMKSRPYTHMTCDTLFGHCEAGNYSVRPLLSRPHTFIGHFEACHNDYVSFCSDIMKQVTHITYDTLVGHYEAGLTHLSAILKQAIIFTCNIGRPLHNRSRTHYV